MLSESDLEELAKGILKERTDSLQNEVRHCILRDKKTREAPAPFSALLYCFSTVDLFGSLYTGRFDEHSDTQNAKVYMKDLMFYTDLQITLLQQIFRHKLVHAAEPKWLYEDNGEFYSWGCYTNYRAGHLRHRILDRDAHANDFSISIWSLVEDIVDSVYRNSGYLNMLLNNQNGRFDNFSKAFEKLSST